MKSLLILTAIAATMIAACAHDKIRTFIPGTYVNKASGEYSIAYDTLTIEQAEKESNNYIIHRKTGFRRITNGKPGKREYETERWEAIYNESTKSMQEIRTGRILTFYPETKRLMVGRREYKKID